MKYTKRTAAVVAVLAAVGALAGSASASATSDSASSTASSTALSTASSASGDKCPKPGDGATVTTTKVDGDKITTHTTGAQAGELETTTKVEGKKITTFTGSKGEVPPPLPKAEKNHTKQPSKGVSCVIDGDSGRPGLQQKSG
ncbi:hypothetical protein ACIHCQ_11615 [Streptomyces sp. NPDC052236]|uniref:hypothetical protein n=1 Tax=Streptomyces sp. NPDC052236 TaxID=3365686 RepID=UPI0037D07B02